jgi:two-component system LytT family response regulator
MSEDEELRVLIIDDEEPSRLALTSLLKEFCPQVRIEKTVSNISDAKQAILQYAPDAIFLDVEMPPEGTGFDLLESIHPNFLRFAVVFTTGHKEYAFQAIRANAVDFLAKPIDIDDLQKAVNKIQQYKRSKRLEKAGSNVQEFLKKMNAMQPKGVRILFPTETGARIVHSGEVAFFTIQPRKTEVHFANGESFVADAPLEPHEQDLANDGFVKTGEHSLVNIKYVQHYIEKEEGGKVVLKNGHSVLVNPLYKEHLFELLKK